MSAEIYQHPTHTPTAQPQLPSLDNKGTSSPLVPLAHVLTTGGAKLLPPGPCPLPPTDDMQAAQT